MLRALARLLGPLLQVVEADEGEVALAGAHAPPEGSLTGELRHSPRPRGRQPSGFEPAVDLECGKGAQTEEPARPS